MNAIRLPFSIWWLRWLLFARFSLMLPSLCWLAAWMDGWMAGWLTGIAVVTVPRFVRNSLLCLVSVVMPLFRPQLNNPNQSSTTSMIDVNRSIGILYGKNFERIFFSRLLSRFTSSWILSSLCCWMQCIRYFCNHRRSCTFIWYCISFRRFASRFDAPSCICTDWNYALFTGFSHQTNFSIQVGAFHSLLLLLLFLCSFFGLILLLFRCCFSPLLDLFSCVCVYVRFESNS